MNKQSAPAHGPPVNENGLQKGKATRYLRLFRPSADLGDHEVYGH